LSWFDIDLVWLVKEDRKDRYHDYDYRIPSGKRQVGELSFLEVGE
jgi:hypothetical protein